MKKLLKERPALFLTIIIILQVLAIISILAILLITNTPDSIEAAR